MKILNDNNGNILLEYSLPQEVKDLITIEFATVLIYELKKVYSLTNIIGVLYLSAGSSGVYEAFRNTCNYLGLDNFLEVSELDWYDFDLFMDEVLDTVGKLFYGEKKYKELCEEFLKNWDLV